MQREARVAQVEVESLGEERVALDLLRQALQASRYFGKTRWEFALECDYLLNQGVSPTTLRTLMSAGLVEAAQEVSEGATAQQRQFRPVIGLTLPAHTCLVLTAQGEASTLRQSGSPPFAPVDRLAATVSTEAVPHWEANSRALYVGMQLVKRFRVPAHTQEAVLRAFEEEAWPPFIDDPISPRAGVDSKRRLHNTINALNRGHRVLLLRFAGNGNGTGIGWQVLESTGSHRAGRQVSHRIDTKSQPDRNQLKSRNR